MKRITITIENEDGNQLMSMAASITTELLLLDLGLANGSQKSLVEILCKQAHMSMMSLSLPQEAANMPDADDNYPVAANASEKENMSLVNGPIRMDTLRHEVYIEGSKISLTPREYDLLHCFLLHQSRILSHRDILQAVWGPEHAEDTQYLRVYIGQLRHKLDAKPGLGKLIVAKAGVGYRMDQAGRANLKAA